MHVQYVDVPDQLIRIEERRDIVARVIHHVEAGVGVVLAQSPLLGLEHHCAQYHESVAGCDGLVPAYYVELRGYVFRNDAVERWQDASVQVDSHGLVFRGFPVQFTALPVLVRDLS